MMLAETIEGAGLAFAFGSVSAAIWLYLALYRGTFWRANQRLSPEYSQLGFWPDVAILVPARNKQGVIGQTRTSRQNQDYPGNWSIFVVGDSSDDGTAVNLQNTRDTQTKFLSGRPLPEG